MKYWFFLLFSTVAWGLNFHLAKIMLQSSTAMEAGLWRYAFGVSLLFFFLRYDWPKWPAVRQQLGPLLLVGFVGLFGFNYCFFIGLSKTSAINAALIAGLNPATTLVCSRLILKTQVTRPQLGGIFMALFGVIFLILKGRPQAIFQLELNEGDAWIFLANVVFALHNVWVKQYGGQLSNRHFTFLTNFICLLGFLLFLPFMKFGNFTYYPRDYWLAALGIGTLGTALAYYFWNNGIGHVGAPRAGIFMNVVPFAAAMFALIFGEHIYLYHITSGLIIIAGVVIMQLKGKGRAKLSP